MKFLQHLRRFCKEHNSFLNLPQFLWTPNKISDFGVSLYPEHKDFLKKTPSNGENRCYLKVI